MNDPGAGHRKRSASKRFLPFLKWFQGYSPRHLRMDFVSGLTVALVLIPQSMAYAQLANLPAYYGLYAAFLPPIVGSLFGSSFQLATGPVAVVSLMTATALAPLATAGGESFIAYAILLSLLVGVFQFALGALRLGLVVNFLSHPVVSGFTNAAALIIATSQLGKIFGVSVERSAHHYETVYNVCAAAVSHTHWPTFGMAALAFAIMVGLKKINPRIPYVLIAVAATIALSRFTGFEKKHTAHAGQVKSESLSSLIDKHNQIFATIQTLDAKRLEEENEVQQARKSRHADSARTIALRHQADLLDFEIQEAKKDLRFCRTSLAHIYMTAVEESDGTLAFYPEGEAPAGSNARPEKWRLSVGAGPLDPQALVFSGGGAVVGAIRKGLPSFKAPRFEWAAIGRLFPMAVIISLLGFMEAISIAKAMAAKTGQRLDPNQELIGQGLANIAGSFTQSYPVSGSFSRSAVNLQTGAVTGLSNVFSSCAVAAALLFFTPYLYHLPQAALAAIIMMAVVNLFNVSGFVHAWQAQRYDGAIGVITFAATLAFAPHLDRGIMIGVSLSVMLYLLRTMKPDIARLARYTDGSYRDAERFGLGRCRHISVIRFNGSLFFTNVNYLEERILDEVSVMPELRHVLIVGNGINEMDSSGEEMLSHLLDRLRESGYEVSISGLNDAVLDVMRRTGLYNRIGEDHLFRSVAMALRTIHEKAHGAGHENEIVGCPLARASFTGLPVSSSAMPPKEGHSEA